MKNVTEMTIEELNAERTKLNELDQAILAGASNANEHDLYERLDLIVQEIDDREKNAKQISITKMLTAIEDIQNCFKDTPIIGAHKELKSVSSYALRVFVRQLPPHIALEMKDELDELIQTRDLEDIKAAEINCEERSYDDMDGDHASALASAGWGTDEDYA
jgi:hypothetical protein